MPFGFGPQARLTDRKQFGRVFQSGRKIVGRSAILWYLETQSGAPPRLGLSVSSKVGIAVRRNRLKRLTREAFRLGAARMREGVDLVVYLRQGCRWEGRADAEKEIFDLCRKAGLLKDS